MIACLAMLAGGCGDDASATRHENGAVRRSEQVDALAERCEVDDRLGLFGYGFGNDGNPLFGQFVQRAAGGLPGLPIEAVNDFLRMDLPASGKYHLLADITNSYINQQFSRVSGWESSYQQRTAFQSWTFLISAEDFQALQAADEVSRYEAISRNLFSCPDGVIEASAAEFPSRFPSEPSDSGSPDSGSIPAARGGEIAQESVATSPGERSGADRTLGWCQQQLPSTTDMDPYDLLMLDMCLMGELVDPECEAPEMAKIDGRCIFLETDHDYVMNTYRDHLSETLVGQALEAEQR